MKKIVIPSDFSVSSKSGLKFAIQLASQYEVKLIFFHSLGQLRIPMGWDDVTAKSRTSEEIRLETERLREFVMETYTQCGANPLHVDCVVRYGAPVSDEVIKFAEDVKASYICMGTQGAGKVRRLIGTHASAVVKKSPIPVFAVPKNYRLSAVKEILFASDFTALKRELRKVKEFAKNLDSSVSVVHYDNSLDQKASKAAFERVKGKTSLPNVKFYLERFDWEKTMSWHLNKAVKKFKIDVVALFSDHKRSWLSKALRGSRSAEMSFDSLKPILVYPK